MEASPWWVARRYRRLALVGRGATGMVHRAQDRLNGRLVALKGLAEGDLTTTADSGLTTHSQSVGRRAELLEREYLLLAKLRHPNIVSAIDYGLDAAGRPFFTMDLEAQASTIREAADAQLVPGKIELLVQLLHALAYLHKRGLVHRDVKPENALVSRGVVKLVDFGLAVPIGDRDALSGGTPAYAAPEVLRGTPADERADLWAVGVIAYELFVGKHPFDTRTPATLLRSVLQSAPDLASLGPELAAIVGKLLARAPADRYARANDVIAALAGYLAQPLPAETLSTREGLLHSAELVGRDAELALLRGHLPVSRTLGDSPTGGAVLVGGESGIGKSRLLEELAASAMVAGVRVFRGQALREASRPYESWRGILRLLALLSDPTDREASVLSGFVTDLALLLDRSVEPAPALDPDATNVRLARVVDALLRRFPEPMLLVLEDMQWAGKESVQLAARVASIASELPLLLVASYRNNERPGLPEELRITEQVDLGRLDAAAVTTLCASMVGSESAHIAELVARESEGNVFAVLEMLRALAEEADGLDRVGSVAEPARLFSGGAERVVQRRIERLSAADRAFLATAAVAGRELDLGLLAGLHPEVDVDACVGHGVEAALLAMVQGRVWFAHDRLRDGLVAPLADDVKRGIHARLAHAILATSPEDAATLAYHFGAAREPVAEQEFAARAGGQFLESGAYHEAIPFLRRSLALEAGEGAALSELARATVERQLGEALFRSGQLQEGRSVLAAALATLGRPLPSSPARLAIAIATEARAQAALRGLRRPWHREPAATAGERARFESLIVGYTELSRLAHHQSDDQLLLYVTLSALNLAERGGLVAHQARLAAVMGAVMGLAPVHRWARSYFATANRLGTQLGDANVRAFVLAHQGYYEAGIARWDEAEDQLTRAIRHFESTGDVRMAEESTSILAYALFFKGELARSLELYRELERSGRERFDAQTEGWGLVNRVKVMVRTGQHEGIDELIARASALVVDDITRTVLEGAEIELELLRRDYEAAGEAAAKLITRLERSPPRSFMVATAYGAMSVAVLKSWKHARLHGDVRAARRFDDLSSRALRALKKLARLFAIAEPVCLLHAANDAKARGKSGRAAALYRSSARAAADNDLPFQEALALGYLANHVRDDSTDDARVRASLLFDRLGTSPTLEWLFPQK